MLVQEEQSRGRASGSRGKSVSNIFLVITASMMTYWMSTPTLAIQPLLAFDYQIDLRKETVSRCNS